MINSDTEHKLCTLCKNSVINGDTLHCALTNKLPTIKFDCDLVVIDFRYLAIERRNFEADLEENHDAKTFFNSFESSEVDEKRYNMEFSKEGIRSDGNTVALDYKWSMDIDQTFELIPWDKIWAVNLSYWEASGGQGANAGYDLNFRCLMGYGGYSLTIGSSLDENRKVLAKMTGYLEKYSPFYNIEKILSAKRNTYCELCEHSSFDKDHFICGLINEPANFNMDCPDISPSAELVKEKKAKYLNEDYNRTKFKTFFTPAPNFEQKCVRYAKDWISIFEFKNQKAIGFGNVLIGGALFFVAWFLFDFDHHFWLNIVAFVLAIGAIYTFPSGLYKLITRGTNEQTVIVGLSANINNLYLIY